jgi:DNA-binding transcriptional ArsR family regulator
MRTLGGEVTGGRRGRSAIGGSPHGPGSGSVVAGVRGGFSLIAVIQRRLYSSDMAVSTELDPGALARIGMALADATRRRVLVHLIGGTGYPAQMAEQFGTTRANLSNHLACLRECGLVTATAEGRRVRYALADDRLADGLRLLAALNLPGCHE